jgi:hypothetical protein
MSKGNKPVYYDYEDAVPISPQANFSARSMNTGNLSTLGKGGLESGGGLSLQNQSYKKYTVEQVSVDGSS